MSDSLRYSELPSLPAPPSDRADLARWVQDVLGLHIPDKAICPSHDAPLDYLEASFLRPKPVNDKDKPADLLVWANRGGGKTMLAAIASLLDAMYKAPINIRILGGSFDQSDRLADHLRGFLSGELSDLVEGRMTRQRIVLKNGADIRMLSQSQRAVRGQHAQKIRCDEVDLFDADVWKALQFATRSSDKARGGVEVYSTLHRSGGLMEQLVNQADDKKTFLKFQWCLWEVIERCGPERRCDDCPLAEDCMGKAKNAEGFYKIDDAISAKARSSRRSWESEMLCLGSRSERAVFEEFDPDVHVADFQYRPDWPMYCAIDFGYVNPFVCLWIQPSPDGVVHVLDEYALEKQTIPKHAVEILRRSAAILAGKDPEEFDSTYDGPINERVKPIAFVDPAGSAKDATSGKSGTDLLAEHGINCIWRGSAIVDGLDLIRAFLDPATGPTRLKIHRRCVKLIKAFQNYQYPPPGAKGDRDKPVKNGPDHFIDAMRYFFVNRMRPGATVRRIKY